MNLDSSAILYCRVSTTNKWHTIVKWEIWACRNKGFWFLGICMWR